MKKIFLFVITITLLLSILTVGVSAQYDGESTKTADGEAVTGEGESTDEVTDAGFFELVYSELERNSEKLFSALAFLGSLLIAFTYKRGLLPTVRAAIESLADAVGKIKQASETQGESANAALGVATEHLAAAEGALEVISDKLATLECRLDEQCVGVSEREKMKLIMSAQTDMLYDIFMCSALPQYQKDIVGEKIADIKRKIEAEE